MVKFLDTKGHIYDFNLMFTDVSSKTSPFKELSEGEYEDITFSNERGRYELKNALRLQVKMNNVGSFTFFTSYPEEKIRDVVEELRSLSDFVVESLESAMNGVTKLFKIMNKYSLLFVVYKEDEKFPLDLAICRAASIVVPVFNIDKELISQDIPAQTKKPKKQEQPETKHKPKEKKEKKESPKFFKSLASFFAPIKGDLLHFGFTLVAAILCGFATSIGVYNSFDGKPIAIFFYVCSAVGAGLNALVNFDTNKGKTLKQSFYVLTFIVSLFGVLLSMGGFAIFYGTQSEIPEAIPNEFVLILLSVLISVIVLVASGAAGIFIARKEKRRED